MFKYRPPRARWQGIGNQACFLLLLLAAADVAQGMPAEDAPDLSLDAIYTQKAFQTESVPASRWFEEGERYTLVEKSAKTKDGKDINGYETATGEAAVLVRAEQLIPAGKEKPLAISDYHWSKDQSKLLIFTNTRKVWRRHTRGDYWVLDLKTQALKKLGGHAEEARLMFAKFSPNGTRVAYVYKKNIYVQSLADLSITQLTKIPKPTIINGTSDWVNEEEFGLRDGFRWSPDGRRIAYWQFDTEGVKSFKLINYTDDLYPKITEFPYPKVGVENSSCRVGVVNLDSTETTWIKAPGDPRNHYIPRMAWNESTGKVVLQQLNRLQNTNKVMLADPETGGVKTLMTDRDDAWVEDQKIHWLDNGKSFLWLSERSGWRRIYRCNPPSKALTVITRGDFDAIQLAGKDVDKGLVYFIASPDNPTQRYLYCASLDEGAPSKRITPADQSGCHNYNISPNGRWALHTYSSFGRPPVTELISLPDHETIRIIKDNAKLAARLNKLKLGERSFFRVSIAKDEVVDGWCIKPSDFDARKRYPLFIYVYGEPAGQTVQDKWGGDNYLWHCLLAEKGYIVVSIDNRGTPAPRGRAWRKSIYRQIGILAAKDQAAATRAILKAWPFVDPKRIGIWGWSGGGSMSLNAIFRYPELYHTAMAIAFVSNQRYYDTIYQERYMGLPDDNAEGFKNGSPITHAHNLKGNLLLVYGTGDDNCHYQNCEALVDRLIKHNKAFTMMAYPNRTHSIRKGDNTRRHLFELLTRYLTTHL